MKDFRLKNQIRVQRAIKKLTQKELAREIGISRRTVGAIEHEKFVPSTVLAIKLSRFFEIKVEDLFELIDM